MSDSSDRSDHQIQPGRSDSWKSADAYEYYMGRWSRLAARVFLDRLSPAHGLDWLDVGCGSGALCEAILNKGNPAKIFAVDQSETFVKGTHDRLKGRAQCLVGDALSLPVASDSVHFTVSGLVLNYIADPVRSLIEMKRVTRSGGDVAVYVWDYTERMELVTKFWDVAVAIDPTAMSQHQSYRFRDWTAAYLPVLFGQAGLTNIESFPVDIPMHFGNFDDYWRPFLGGQGPAPTYLMSVDESVRKKIHDRLAETLPIQQDGSIHLRARAWAARGRVLKEASG